MKLDAKSLALVLLCVGLVAPLVTFFVVGRAQVVRAQLAVANDLSREAADRTDSRARAIERTLDELRAVESARPYYQYQRLYHDPRAIDQGASLVPSPLAELPAAGPIRAYFQLDAQGVLTTFPEDPATRMAIDDARERLEVAVGEGSLGGPGSGNEEVALAPQVVHVPKGAYFQNANPTVVYNQITTNQLVPEAGQKGDVVVLVDSFVYYVLQLGDARAVTALRAVTTPAGKIVQGFVVRDDALQGAIVHVGAASADARPLAIGLVLGSLEVPRELADPSEITASQRALWSSFLVRFVPVALLALVAGVSVLFVIVRTTRLANERSRFAAMAAHELRTPLAGLRLYGEMLSSGLGDRDAAPRYAQRIADESARLARVVTNVLGFTRLERGALEVRPRRADLAAAIREEIDRMHPTVEALGATLLDEIEDVAEVAFDRDALVQILHNLVDNAEKYGRNAPNRAIHVRLERRGEEVALSVEDHGPGVARAVVARLFRPFARGASADDPAGLGLGLSLGRALARAHRGDLRYAPAPDGGSVFTVTLPAQASIGADRSAPKAATFTDD